MNGKGNNRDGKSGSRDSRDRKRPPAANGGASKGSSRAPEQTFEEVRYLKQLIENRTPIRVRLINNEEVSGTVEYYDQSFIRLTREPENPNLFIFKHEIKYFYELE